MLTKTLHIPLLKSAPGKAGTAGVIVGYGSVFNIKDDQGDIVARGAFAASLRQYRKTYTKPAMLWQHDDRRPCGVWTKTEEDAVGLLLRGQLNLGTQLGREAYQLVKQGAVTGLSIGYRIVRARYDATQRARVLEQIELDEISLVTLPANRAARVSSVKHTKDMARTST